MQRWCAASSRDCSSRVPGPGQGNPINGEFSANVFLGYKIEDGEIVGRVKDVMLAGNAYDALKDIVAISREQERMGGRSPGSPAVALYPVGKLSVVAKVALPDATGSRPTRAPERRSRGVLFVTSSGRALDPVAPAFRERCRPTDASDCAHPQ